MSTQTVGTIAHGPATAHKLDAIGWGLFFIWIGIALLANLGWGVGLLGTGLLVLGMQATCKYMGLRLDAFWIVVGALFALGGIWELLTVRISLIPVVCISAGVALLVSTLFGKSKG